MTLPDYPDWEQPVALAERITQLFSGTLADNSGLVQLDTSNTQSISVSITPPAGAAGLAYELQLLWINGASFVEYQAVSFHTLASYGFPPNPIVVQVPARASTLRAVMQGNHGSNVAVVIYGSTRQVLSPAVSRIGSTGPQLLAAPGSLVVPAAGVSATVYVPPTASRVRIGTDSALATTQLRVSGWNVGAGGAVLNTELFRQAGNGVTPITAEFYAPLFGLSFILANSSGAAIGVTPTVWDVS